MTSEKRTYIPCIPDALVQSVGFEAAALACKLPAFADENGAICVSFQFLADLWGVDKRTIKKAAEKLAALQIWSYEKHHGRGLVTEWKKGANFVSFIGEKKVHILQEKGTQNVPYNKDTRNNNMRAGARVRYFNKNNSQGTPLLPRKGTRWSHDEYYAHYGDTALRPTIWKHYKPEGYSKFIFEKL